MFTGAVYVYSLLINTLQFTPSRRVGFYCFLVVIRVTSPASLSVLTAYFYHALRSWCLGEEHVLVPATSEAESTTANDTLSVSRGRLHYVSQIVWKTKKEYV